MKIGCNWCGMILHADRHIVYTVTYAIDANDKKTIKKYFFCSSNELKAFKVGRIHLIELHDQCTQCYGAAVRAYVHNKMLYSFCAEYSCFISWHGLHHKYSEQL